MKLTANRVAVLDSISTLLDTGRYHVSRGDRNKLSPEAQHWVERGLMPSKNTDMDTLRGIRWMLQRGIPKIEEDQGILILLREKAEAALQRAQDLWKRGEGRQLPKGAVDASLRLPEAETAGELEQVIRDLGMNP